MARIKITSRKTKHQLLPSSREANFKEYVVQIGTKQFPFGQYYNDQFLPGKGNEEFGIDPEKSFKTREGCRKYILNKIAVWVNKNFNLEYEEREPKVGLLRFPSFRN